MTAFVAFNWTPKHDQFKSSEGLAENASVQSEQLKQQRKSHEMATVATNHSKHGTAITTLSLPKHWPEGQANNQALRFPHPNSTFWQQQVMAHEAQATKENSPGWQKLERYALENNLDLLALPTFTQADSIEKAEHIYTVRLLDDIRPETLNSSFTHLRSLSSIVENLHSYQYEGSLDASAVLEQLNSLASVRYAEGDYAVEFTAAPNDPGFDEGTLSPDDPSNHGLGYGNTWWLNQINAYQAWDYSSDATAIGPIAVVDSTLFSYQEDTVNGYAYPEAYKEPPHPDLVNNFWNDPREVVVENVAPDGLPYTEHAHGVVLGLGRFAWAFSHGLGVGGTICAQGNDDTGVVGVAWNCQLMDVEFARLNLANGSGGFASSFVSGVSYAVRKGSRISNHSYKIQTSLAVMETVESAALEDHLIVTSAYNDNIDIDTGSTNMNTLTYDNIIVVASSTEAEQRKSNSGWGALSVDLAAPQNFLTPAVDGFVPGTETEGAYQLFSDTSQAAPVVTGALALAWAQVPECSYLDMRNHLLTNGVRASTNWTGLTVTEGILDLGNMMATLATIPCRSEAPYNRGKAIAEWQNASAEVIAAGNRVNAINGDMSAPKQVNSQALSNLGLTGDFSVDWKVGSDPSVDISTVGLGITETDASVGDVDFGFLNYNGYAIIFENGVHAGVPGGAISAGSKLGFEVIGQQINYLIDGVSVHTAAFTGSPDFYIDSSFMAAGSMSYEDFRVKSLDKTEIRQWVNADTGVNEALNSVVANEEMTSNAQINSQSFSSLGFSDNYRLSWIVGSDPGTNISSVGIGETESDSTIYDIDYGFFVFNSSNTIYATENGSFSPLSPSITPTIGMELALEIDGGSIRYLVDGAIVRTSTYSGQTPDFYVDTAFIPEYPVTYNNFSLQNLN